MSWVAQHPKSKVSTPATAEALDFYGNTYEGMNFDDDTKQQIAVALEAVNAIVASGVVGNAYYKATLNGHDNPNHGPRDGFTDPIVQVSVFGSFTEDNV